MDDRAIIKSFEKGWGQRAAILGFAVVMLAILIAALFFGFRGRHIARNAAALTPVKVLTPVAP